MAQKSIAASVSRIEAARAEVRRRRNSSLDGATPERAIRAGAMQYGLETADAGFQRLAEAPFDRMAIYKQITFRQHEAGERFRNIAFLAKAEPSTGSPDWNTSHAGFGPSTPSMFSSQAIANARGKHRKAVEVIGPRLYRVVSMVLLDELRLEDVGREVAGYSQRKPAVVAGATLFRLALDVLADHYSLTDDSLVRIRRRRHAWMAEGAKPVDLDVEVARPERPAKPSKGSSAA